MIFKIEGKEQIANAGIGTYLQSLDYEHPWMVEVKPWSEKRRTKQNALSWIWYNELAELIGDSAEDQHNYCKLTYGAPILAGVNQEFADFYENTLLMMPYEVRLEMISFIPVTSLLTVKKFAEYLTKMEQQSAIAGHILSKPDDSYWEALGYKRR